MNIGICGIDKLTENDSVFLSGNLLGFGNRALHTGRPFGQNDFRSVSGDEITSFDGHRFRHNYHHSVTFCDARGGNSYTRISRSRLDYHRIFYEFSVLFGFIYHSESDSVLNAARRIEIFEFCVNFRF